MNTDSVDCRRRVYGDFSMPLEPGDFVWDLEERAGGIRYLYIRIPGSDADGYDALKCFRGPDRGIEREWGWDGNEEKPTLTPSIKHGEAWHGHLVAGRLVSC